mgnify:FL=1
MTARPERDPLGGDAGVGDTIVVSGDQLVDIDQIGFFGW